MIAKNWQPRLDSLLVSFLTPTQVIECYYSRLGAAVQVEELDSMFRDCCAKGENLAFAVLIAGRPSPILMIRASGSTGAGIIEKTQKFLKNLPDVRQKLGAGKVVRHGKMAIIFLSIIPARSISSFRRQWYRKKYLLAETIHGRNSFSATDLVKLIDDKTIQFQISFDLDTLEIQEQKSFERFEDLLDSPSRMRTAMNRASAINEGY